MAAPTKTANTAVKPEKPKYTGRFLTPSDGMKITRVAREWAKAGTPYGTGKYKGPGAVKGEGADCSGATWAIYKEAGFPYGDYLNTVRFVNLVATDTHFIAAWLKEVVGADADFVKDKHFFKKVALPQTGDIGWWHNGKIGHVVIYDLDAGMTPKGARGNVWTATTGGDPFAPGLIKWFDKDYNAPPKWFRYWKLEPAK